VRIAVIGDTHGRITGICRALAKNPPDHLIHTGDFYADACKIAETLNRPFHAVSGNCDAKKDGPAELLLKLAGRRIYVVHGHQYGVKKNLNNIYYRGQEMEADIVIFGHTHVPFCEKLGELWLLNPGSASRPRLTKLGRYICLNVEEQAINPEICKIKP
jgi:hypothetical protein